MHTTHRAMRVERLTAEVFRPFGDVIEARDAGSRLTINRGRAERFDDLAFVDATEGRGRPAISIVRSQASPLPIRLTLLERHLLTRLRLRPTSAMHVCAAVGASV